MNRTAVLSLAAAAALVALAFAFADRGGEEPAGPAAQAESPTTPASSAPPPPKPAPTPAELIQVHWATRDDARVTWLGPSGLVSRTVRCQEVLDVTGLPEVRFLGGARSGSAGDEGTATFQCGEDFVTLRWKRDPSEPMDPVEDDPPPFGPPPAGPDEGPPVGPGDPDAPPPPDLDPEREEEKRRERRG